ncbi:hypothetical protein BASA61_001146 [Batrachochytrium salamandrivorans]|nr:hypothetical protein BASA61_001146 [Batrachochytrium salamandrivorans]
MRGLTTTTTAAAAAAAANIVTMTALRYRTRNLYKQANKLKKAFFKKKDLHNAAEIEKAIAHGEYVYKELEALWFIKKYRAMKRNYANEEHDAQIRALLREHE